MGKAKKRRSGRVRPVLAAVFATSNAAAAGLLALGHAPTVGQLVGLVLLAASAGGVAYLNIPPPWPLTPFQATTGPTPVPIT